MLVNLVSLTPVLLAVVGPPRWSWPSPRWSWALCGSGTLVIQAIGRRGQPNLRSGALDRPGSSRCAHDICYRRRVCGVTPFSFPYLSPERTGVSFLLVQPGGQLRPGEVQVVALVGCWGAHCVSGAYPTQTGVVGAPGSRFGGCPRPVV